MRIAGIDTYILKAPLGAARFWSSQAGFDHRKALLVRVETDNGLTGWGEGGQYGPAEPVAATIHSVFAPLLLGEDPRRPEVLWERMYTHTRDFGRKGSVIEAISGIDVALWDILGQSLGAPVHALWGGAFRESVPVYATGLYYRGEHPADPGASIAAARQEARSLADHGFPAIKMKVGLLAPDQEVARVAAVRAEIGGEILLMVDANHAWPAHVAARFARRIEPYNIYWFEEPVVPEDIDGYVQVRNSSGIAIAGGECEYTRHGFRELLARGAVDIVQPDICASGGLSEARRIAALASAYNVQCFPHVWGSGVAIAAGLHFVSTLPPAPHTAAPLAPYNLPMLEWDANANPLRTDLLDPPLVPSAGKLAVPRGAGLGIRINETVLERYCQSRLTSA
ncbi:MAG: mandelate racemase/muconate lactonizing enzyme family protein [Acidobacteria bacterium]|nr:mandelate racemase/muconate lactonizing enzyme family protein [Acidobacteriota bacterium]MBI3278246.1 mandelate racemase/muconate lactonizing enzyme family protein [Acidobacteriota bacterium]